MIRDPKMAWRVFWFTTARQDCFAGLVRL